jgi:hypothetical protein
MILAAVLQQFRLQSHHHYRLDPAHYFSLPGYTFDAALRMTNQTLKLITDERVYEMIEDSIRGGLSFVGKRYSKANNPYMLSYDEEKDSVYIIYLDANNLYGYCMISPLPIGNFTFIDSQSYPDEFLFLSQIENILTLDPLGEKCYFFNINGYIPDELHDYFKDFPLFPENLKVTKEMFSEFQKDVYSDYELNPTSRLMSTLTKKENYVTHFRMLQFAINHGFVVTKINSVAVCDQRPWLSDYIEFNNQLRTEADVEGDSFKVNNCKNMNNMFYGKTVEQVRNRTNVVIKFDDNSAQKAMSKPSYKRNMKLNEEMLLIESTIQKLT